MQLYGPKISDKLSVNIDYVYLYSHTIIHNMTKTLLQLGNSLRIKVAYWISSNIAIALLNFSLLLPIELSLFQLCDSKVVALNPFT